MRARMLLLIHFPMLVATSLIGIACFNSEGTGPTSEPPRSDGGPDVVTGTGGSSTGAGGGPDGSSGAGGGMGGSGGASGNAGASGSGGRSGSSGASGNAGAAGNAGNAGSGGASTDAGSGTEAGPADVDLDRNVVTDVMGDAGCPDVFGTYEVSKADGTCDDLNDKAPQEIRGTTQACSLHFISVVDGGIGAINGGATLDVDGKFSGATLMEGTAMRSPCSGTWREKDERMVIVCGGASDKCTVELRRQGP